MNENVTCACSNKRLSSKWFNNRRYSHYKRTQTLLWTALMQHTF